MRTPDARPEISVRSGESERHRQHCGGMLASLARQGGAMLPRPVARLVRANQLRWFSRATGSVRGSRLSDSRRRQMGAAAVAAAGGMLVGACFAGGPGNVALCEWWGKKQPPKPAVPLPARKLNPHQLSRYIIIAGPAPGDPPAP